MTKLTTLNETTDVETATHTQPVKTSPPNEPLKVAVQHQQPLTAKVAPRDPSAAEEWDEEEFMKKYNKFFADINDQYKSALKLSKHEAKKLGFFELKNGESSVGNIKYNKETKILAFNFGAADSQLANGFTNLDLLAQTIVFACKEGSKLDVIDGCTPEIRAQLIAKLEELKVDLSSLQIMGDHGKYEYYVKNNDGDTESKKITEQEPEEDLDRELDAYTDENFDPEHDVTVADDISSKPSFRP